MKQFNDILGKVDVLECIGSTAKEINAVQFDSRKVQTGDVFVAVRGTQVDGHKYITKAIELGAVAVVCQEVPTEKADDVVYVQVSDSAKALAELGVAYCNAPSAKLKLIAVTGTNGKTSIATLLHQLFSERGYKCGLLSTVVNKIGTEELSATHTTPDAVSVNKLLAEMVEQGCDFCFMEASSHAIHQHRTWGLDFDGAVFTNITHDHLDYHGTFKEYIQAKKALFDQLKKDAFALVNVDDKNGEVMVQNCKAQIKRYGVKQLSDFKAKVLENQFSGLQLQIDGMDVWTRLVGGFNAYNLLAVYAVAVLLEEDKMDVLTDLSNLQAVEGRFQYIHTENDITGIVDYAHTPDALKNVLSTVKDIRTGNEKVITVVGCGGDRDKTKRPEMAKIACEFSDKVLFTSDNPRTEDPEVILDDMMAGVEPSAYKKTLKITNRREAIKTAVSLAEAGDILLVAGKGHEKYQEIQGVRHDFDDMAVLNEMLELFNQ